MTRDRISVRGAVCSPVTVPCMGGMCGLWEEVWVEEAEGSTSEPSESVERWSTEHLTCGSESCETSDLLQVPLQCSIILSNGIVHQQSTIALTFLPLPPLFPFFELLSKILQHCLCP